MDDALFGDEQSPTGPAEAEQTTTPSIADWQVEQLRAALTAHGLQDVFERQRLIEELAGRTVSSLRDLSSSEARVLLEKLAARGMPPRSSRSSSWEDREEDTWIDRL